MCIDVDHMSRGVLRKQCICTLSCEATVFFLSKIKQNQVRISEFYFGVPPGSGIRPKCTVMYELTVNNVCLRADRKPATKQCCALNAPLDPLWVVFEEPRCAAAQLGASWTRVRARWPLHWSPVLLCINPACFFLIAMSPSFCSWLKKKMMPQKFSWEPFLFSSCMVALRLRTPLVPAYVLAVG